MNIDKLLGLQHKYREISDDFSMMVLFGNPRNEWFYQRQESKYEKLFIRITREIIKHFSERKVYGR